MYLRTVVFRNRNTLNVRIIGQDVLSMKAAGANTIERIMPGLYDDKVEKITAIHKINLIPRFWSPDNPGTFINKNELAQQKASILQTVTSKKTAGILLPGILVVYGSI